MPEAFVPLAAYLRGGLRTREELQEVTMPEAAESREAPHDVAAEAALGALFAQIRRTRAALEDACEARIERFLCDLGATILGRELRLAPADVGAIVNDALAELRCDLPLGVRVHPDDLPALHACELTAIPDATLRRGDVTIDVRHGSIDVSLGARFDALLDACRQA